MKMGWKFINFAEIGGKCILGLGGMDAPGNCECNYNNLYSIVNGRLHLGGFTPVLSNLLNTWTTEEVEVVLEVEGCSNKLKASCLVFLFILKQIASHVVSAHFQLRPLNVSRLSAQGHLVSKNCQLKAS